MALKFSTSPQKSGQGERGMLIPRLRFALKVSAQSMQFVVAFAGLFARGLPSCG
jgi:hypothetical protein